MCYPLVCGGSIYDIMTTYGISHTEALDSVWYVVEAVNNHPLLNLSYPSNINKQHQIVAKFQAISTAGFNCCAGAIDVI
jgi:hypothetical protein